MFAKIFTQIFDSSIAENYLTRHVFMDLLVLADSEGCVDMTQEAISRRTNVPLDIVRNAVKELCSPDHQSRTAGDEGRRLLSIDVNRPWGWRIVNYAAYRAIRDEEARRAYHREYRRAERAQKKVKRKVKAGVPDEHDPDGVLGPQNGSCGLNYPRTP